MTFFQRIKTPFTESPTEEQARLQPRMRLVGELLQERREDLGLDLDEIGAMLRIKPAYLAALEQGRIHELPGPAYAIGFVRAYSDFLGLDTEQVLSRFKAQAAGVTARPDLTLPVPLGERSLPGGALVLVALILALCGYGVWYYLSTEERSRPERVAAVPAALQVRQPTPVLVPPPALQTPSAGGGEGSQSPPPPQPSSLYGAAAGSAPPAPAPTSSATAQPEPASPGANLAPGTLIDTIPRGSPAGVATPSAAPPAPRPTPAQQSPSQLSAATPASAASPPQKAAATAVPAPQGGPTAASSPSVGAEGRITIRALADCWIQVRAADQSIVFSRVLKSGEVYAVPARSGLTLRTGNAGVLEIAVDGKAVPSIGGIGTLRRDVALDPKELTAGTAVHG